MTTRFKRPSPFSFLALVLFSALTIGTAGSGAGTGIASGSGSASYELTFPNGEVVVPSCKNDGYEQRAVKSGDKWKVEVKSVVDPLRVRESWSLSRKMERSLASLNKELGRALTVKLSGVSSRDEAAMQVFRCIAARWRYVEKDDGGKSMAELLASKEASCLGMVMLAKQIFSIIGIPSNEMIGIRFPASGSDYTLRGGALHAWIEVEVEKGKWVFCDPTSTFGFVTQYFIVLKQGGGFTKEELNAMSGGTVSLRSNEDRIFYDPLSASRPAFWRRLQYDAATQGVLLGKALMKDDLPALGKAKLSCGDKILDCDIWEGNFYFKIASAGLYTLEIAAEKPGKSSVRQLQLSDVSRKKLIIDAERGEVSQ